MSLCCKIFIMPVVYECYHDGILIDHLYLHLYLECERCSSIHKRCPCVPFRCDNGDADLRLMPCVSLKWESLPANICIVVPGSLSYCHKFRKSCLYYLDIYGNSLTICHRTGKCGKSSSYLGDTVTYVYIYTTLRPCTLESHVLP